MVGGLEDSRFGNPRSGIPQGEIRALAGIFEGNPWRKPWKKQVQPHIPTDTSYVTAFTRVFRDPERAGRPGRPRLVAIPGLLLGQVIKRHSGRRLVDVARRVVLGTAEAVAGVLAATGTGAGVNTSYIERLNATFRASMCPLVRRGRSIVRGEGVLTGWMYLVGCAYNFCWEHGSLRVAAGPGGQLKWCERTPAMAAGLTDHAWTMHELLSQPIPLPHWLAPRRRGRPPERLQATELVPA
jgi:hypothetical protein